jgi:hypothetical protein
MSARPLPSRNAPIQTSERDAPQSTLLDIELLAEERVLRKEGKTATKRPHEELCEHRSRPAFGPVLTRSAERSEFLASTAPTENCRVTVRLNRGASRTVQGKRSEGAPSPQRHASR